MNDAQTQTAREAFCKVCGRPVDTPDHQHDQPEDKIAEYVRINPNLYHRL